LSHTKADDSHHTPFVIFNVSGEREVSSLSLYSNYTDYKKVHDKISKQSESFSKVSLLPLKRIKFEKLDFASLLKKIFELDVEF